jgi:hypothetical protein
MTAASVGPVLAVVVIGGASAMGSSHPVTHPAVHPAVGGLTTVVHVRVMSEGSDAEGYNELQVFPPRGTSCAGAVGSGPLAYGTFNASGLVTLYIGPRAQVRYPAITNAFELAGPNAGYAAWCPGTYTGRVLYKGGGPIPPSPESTFRFRISASKRIPSSKTAVARDLERVTVRPALGTPSRIFAVHYRADRARATSGDVVEVDGPRHTACQGVLVRTEAETAYGTQGALTLHIGPSANEVQLQPIRNGGFGTPVREWCAGIYRGTILYENVMKFTVIGRFKLRVAK